MNLRHKTNLIAVHCSATPAHMDVGVLQIRQWHIDKGWDDIGYHFVIRRDGMIQAGRGIQFVGAHVQGHNADSIGVCLVGGTDDAGKAQNNFTPEQFRSLAVILKRLRELYPHTIICGHRDLSPDLNGDGIVEPQEWVKQCPSFDVRAWLDTENIIQDERQPPPVGTGI